MPKARLSPQTPEAQVPFAARDQLPDSAYVPYAELYGGRQNQHKTEPQDLKDHERAFDGPRRQSGHDVRRVYNNSTKATSSRNSSDYSQGQRHAVRGKRTPPSKEGHMVRWTMDEWDRPREEGQGRGSLSGSRPRRRSRGRKEQLQRQQVGGPRLGWDSLPNPKEPVQQKGGVEGLVTPLRVGLAMGAFYSSLCLWMAHREFGRGAHTEGSPGAEAKRHTKETGGKRPSRSSRGSARDEPDHQSRYQSDTESEDEECYSRATAYAREQARLDVDRDRHMRGLDRQAHD